MGLGRTRSAAGFACMAFGMFACSHAWDEVVATRASDGGILINGFTLCEDATPFTQGSLVPGLDFVPEGVDGGANQIQKYGDIDARLTPDEKKVYFSSSRWFRVNQPPVDSDTVAFELFVAERASRTEPFGAIRRLRKNPETLRPRWEKGGFFAPGSDTLYFERSHYYKNGAFIDYLATAQPDGTGGFKLAGEFCQYCSGAYILKDRIYFRQYVNNDWSIGYMPRNDSAPSTQVATTLERKLFGEKTPWNPVLTEDERTLFYSTGPLHSPVEDVHGMYVMTRLSTTSEFSKPQEVFPGSSSDAGTNIVSTLPTWISPDRCRLYYAQHNGPLPLQYRIYVSERKPTKN